MERSELPKFINDRTIIIKPENTQKIKKALKQIQ